jgi:hypothetical protein
MKEKSLFFLAMFMVAFQALVSFPLVIWSYNQFNFSISLWESVGLLVCLSLAILLLLLLVAFSIPVKLRSYLMPFFVLISILIFFQQNILVWDYGFLDGSQIDFVKNNYLGWVDLSLWVFGGGTYIFLRKQIINQATNILLFVCLVTIGSLTSLIMSYDHKISKSSMSFTEENKFSFSDKKNIFLFVLDGFQSDLFWEIIDNEPEIRDDFSGFKFYPDTASVFAKTYPTIPLLLTGKVYKKQQPILNFFQDAYQNSILTNLKDEGWDVGLYPHFKSSVSSDSSVASNYTNSIRYSETISNYLQALDLSLFRMVPHFLKSYIYNDGDFIMKEGLQDNLYAIDNILKVKNVVKLPKSNSHQGINFLENLRKLSDVHSESPAFRFYHLMMPHEPFVLNRDLKYGRIGNDFNAYREYAYASLKLMISYLKELKRLGVYDNSAIIITADHGGGEYNNNKYLSDEGRYSSVLEDGEAKASGKPLLLVKNYYDEDSLKFSSKPISLLDVAPTIANFAGINAKGIGGMNIEEIADEERRKRTYYYYQFTGFDSKYLDDFIVYEINGDVYDDNAWTKTGKLTADLNTDNKNDYALGNIVRYGSDIKIDADHSNAFLVGEGYSYTHSSVVSSNGRIGISLNLDPPLNFDENYALEVKFAPGGNKFDITLEANDSVLSSFKVNSKNNRHVEFIETNKINASDKLVLDLYVSNDTGSNGSLAISSLKLQKANLTNLDNDSEIRFSESLDKYYATGFWSKESWGRWTSSKESMLNFLSSSDICKNTYMHLNISSFYTNVNPGSFEIFLNGEKLESIYIEKNKKGINYYFKCTQLNETKTRINKLLFKTDSVVAPAELGDSPDSRTLGVGIVSLGFVGTEAINTAIDEFSCVKPGEFTGNMFENSWRGLSVAESWGRWSDGSYVIGYFRFSDANCSPDRIVMKLKGYINKQNPKVSATILLNRKIIGEIALTHGEKIPHDFTFSIPPNLIESEAINQLEFQISNPASPKSLGLSADARLLGLAFESIGFQ